MSTSLIFTSISETLQSIKCGRRGTLFSSSKLPIELPPRNARPKLLRQRTLQQKRTLGTAILIVLTLDDRTLSAESGEYVGYVTGVVKNECDRDFSYVQVEVKFYGADGSLADSGLANVNNLHSGDSWTFKAVSSSESGTWRLEKISGF